MREVVKGQRTISFETNAGINIAIINCNNAMAKQPQASFRWRKKIKNPRIKQMTKVSIQLNNKSDANV
jgi:hypothetical protein